MAEKTQTIKEHDDRSKQRMAFLCEVDKRVESNLSEAVPYEKIANSLNFGDKALEQVYNYFLHEECIFEMPPMPMEVLLPEGRGSPNQKIMHGRAIAITEKGIERAKQYREILNEVKKKP